MQFAQKACEVNDSSSSVAMLDETPAPTVVAAAYDALSPSDTALLFMGTGVVGVVLYLLILLSYLYVPIIKAQHPAAELVIWQVFCGLMACIGSIVAYANVVREPCQGDFCGDSDSWWCVAFCFAAARSQPPRHHIPAPVVRRARRVQPGTVGQ
jgi:hypothetical protein